MVSVVPGLRHELLSLRIHHGLWLSLQINPTKLYSKYSLTLIHFVNTKTKCVGEKITTFSTNAFYILSLNFSVKPSYYNVKFSSTLIPLFNIKTNRVGEMISIFSTNALNISSLNSTSKPCQLFNVSIITLSLSL